MNLSLKQRCWVDFRTEVLNADGSVAKTARDCKNLVLDSGLNFLGLYTYAAAIHCFRFGTGTTPTKRGSGLTTFTLAGTALTSNGAFFEVADVGRLFKADSGEEVYITAFTSSAQVTVANPSAVAFAAQPGTIWYVNQTTLDAEAGHATNNVNTTSFNAGVWTLQSVKTSNAFTEQKLITEVGWSPEAGGSLFGRALVPDGGDLVGVGKQYRVTVSLSVDYSGMRGTQGDITTGDTAAMNSAGEIAIEHVPAMLSPIEFCSKMAAGHNAAALQAGIDAIYYNLSTYPGEGGDAGRDVSMATYVPGNFYVERYTTFSISELNYSINSFLIAGTTPNNWAVYGRYKLTTPQTKDNLHTLTVRFRFGFGRKLVN